MKLNFFIKLQKRIFISKSHSCKLKLVFTFVALFSSPSFFLKTERIFRLWGLSCLYSIVSLWFSIVSCVRIVLFIFVFANCLFQISKLKVNKVFFYKFCNNLVLLFHSFTISQSMFTFIILYLGICASSIMARPHFQSIDCLLSFEAIQYLLPLFFLNPIIKRYLILF